MMTNEIKTDDSEIVPIAFENARELTPKELDAISGGTTVSGTVTIAPNGRGDGSGTIDISF